MMPEPEREDWLEDTLDQVLTRSQRDHPDGGILRLEVAARAIREKMRDQLRATWAATMIDEKAQDCCHRAVLETCDLYNFALGLYDDSPGLGSTSPKIPHKP